MFTCSGVVDELEVWIQRCTKTFNSLVRRQCAGTSQRFGEFGTIPEQRKYRDRLVFVDNTTLHPADEPPSRGFPELFVTFDKFLLPNSGLLPERIDPLPLRTPDLYRATTSDAD